jgi:hypothetical protein
MTRLQRSILLVVVAWCVATILGALPQARAASYQVASVLVDTEANIRAKTGLYTGQRAFANDQNSIEMRWTGSTWVWAPSCQNVYRVRGDVTAQTTDTAEHALATYTLPKLGTEDSVRVAAFLTVANNANAKTLKVNVGTAGSMASGFTLDLASNTVMNLITEMRNQANAASQEWFSNNKAIVGLTSGSLSTTTKDTGTAGKLLEVTMTKATPSDSVVLNWLDISICGAGVP